MLHVKSLRSCFITNSARVIKKYRYSTIVHEKLIDLLNQQDTNPKFHRIFATLVKEYWSESRITDYNQNYIDSQKTLVQNSEFKTLLPFLKHNYNKMRICRDLIRWDLLRNCSQFDLLEPILIQLPLKLDSKKVGSGFQILSVLVKDCILRNEVGIAVQLFLAFYKDNESDVINNALLSSLVSALSIINPKYDQYHLSLFLELVNLVIERTNHFPLTEIQSIQLCNKALSLESNPDLTNTVINKLLDLPFSSTETTNNFKDFKITTTYKIINDHYEQNNVAGVYSRWCEIKNSYNPISGHDSRIIGKVIDILTKNRAYRYAVKEIITSLPPDYYCNNIFILPKMLKYVTKVKNFELAENIMHNINTFPQNENFKKFIFSRGIQSCLLKMHLVFKDSDGVDRILKQIVSRHGSLDENDYQALISEILSSNSIDDLKKGIIFLKKIPKSKRMPSIASILIKVIDLQLSLTKDVSSQRFMIDTINELVEMAHGINPDHSNGFWDILASLFIKKLTYFKIPRHEKEGIDRLKTELYRLDEAKLWYLNSRNTSNNFEKITINPFREISNIKLKITTQNRLIILRNIALNSIKVRRKDIFEWCCSEMYKNKMSVEDLILNWNMMLKHQIRRSKYHSKEEITKALKLDGIKFIHRILK